MSSIPPNIHPLFEAAGFAGHSAALLERGISAEVVANSIFDRFGGLEVGQCGPGQECASSNIRFFRQQQEEKIAAVSPWANSVPRLCAIADAHNDHMIVFVDSEGEYYFFTDPDEQLYFGGKSFGEAMERLLLGKAYGPAIERSV